MSYNETGLKVKEEEDKDKDSMEYSSSSSSSINPSAPARVLVPVLARYSSLETIENRKQRRRRNKQN